MNVFTLFTAKAWKKNDVEVIEYGGKIWISQGHLGKRLDIANIAGRTQYYSDEFKKMRCEIQECGKYQPRRMFIENTLAVETTMSAVKTQAVIFREHDKVLRKQQSSGLRLKRLFPNEEIKEEYFELHYRTVFTFKKHMLVVEIDEKGHIDRDLDYERKRQKELEKLNDHLIRINSDKPGFDDYEEFGRVSAYIAESIKKQTEKSTKKSLIDDLSKILKNRIRI